MFLLPDTFEPIELDHRKRIEQSRKVCRSSARLSWFALGFAVFALAFSLVVACLTR